MRARNQLEKWSRRAWNSSDSSGTRAISRISARELWARPTSLPSGRRNTKSPKPNWSRMKPRSSFSRLGDCLCRNRAPAASAAARPSGSDDWITTGSSGSSRFRRRTSSRPASARSSPVPGEAGVADGAEQVVAVAPVEVQRLLEVGGEQDLRAGAHAQELLRQVDAVGHQLLGLPHDLGVQHGQVGRVEADRVLDQQDAAHVAVARVVVDVPAVLDVLDDGQQEPHVAGPDEGAVDRPRRPGRRAPPARGRCSPGRRPAGRA